MRKAISALAAGLLIAALIFFNLPEAREAGGSAVGETLPDFSVTCVNGDPFTLSAQRGKVTVINVWATWCGPCIQEMAGFDRLQREYPQDVAVLMLHSELVTEDVTAWLSGYDYDLAFAVDEEGRIAALLGASDLLPQTVILDRAGKVIYNRAGAMGYEALRRLTAEGF